MSYVFFFTINPPLGIKVSELAFWNKKRLALFPQSIPLPPIVLCDSIMWLTDLTGNSKNYRRSTAALIKRNRVNFKCLIPLYDSNFLFVKTQGKQIKFKFSFWLMHLKPFWLYKWIFFYLTWWGTMSMFFSCKETLFTRRERIAMT